MLETKDICEILGVASNTVRKYAMALEAQGYVITRDASKNRVYTELDATAFRELQALRTRTGLTVEKCAEVIAARHKDPTGSVAPAVISDENGLIVQHDERYGELINVINKMSEHSQQQQEQMERLAKRLDDQNANLSVILREVLETRRMIAAGNVRKPWQFWKKKNVDSDPDPEAQWRKREKRLY